MKDLALLFLLMGLGCLLGAVLFKKGERKKGFLPEPVNLQTPRDWAYGSVPTGLGFLLASIGLFVGSRLLTLIGLFSTVPFALVFMALKPRWIQPDWLLWLRDHYPAQMVEFMLDRARQNSKGWEARVFTQAGLEDWAAEMAQQYEAQVFIRPRNS
jgi:hypothetical protein